MGGVVTRADPIIVRGRVAFLKALRGFLEERGYAEVQTPLLHTQLAGFERAVGFSTYSASLGERLWFRAAPELYLKRLLIDWGPEEADKVFEVALCLRDDFDEAAPVDSFDRPEFTLLELYAVDDDHNAFEGLLRDAIAAGVQALWEAGAHAGVPATAGDWARLGFGDALRNLDTAFDLEGLLAKSAPRSNGADAEAQAEAIEVRAADTALVTASEGLLRRTADLSPYLRRGPQGYWFEFLERAFREGVAPSLVQPTVVHSLPLESSPLAQSSDGVHCDKWELYMGGLRVALAQRELMDAEAQAVRFRHIDHLRRQGYDVLPEPDRRFVEELRRWPAGTPLVGMGIYVDRLLGVILGLVTPDGRGQERMLPNVFKRYGDS